MKNQWLVVVAALCGTVFWALVPSQPYELSPIVKVSAVVALFAYVLSNVNNGRRMDGVLLLIALVAHGTGDVLLDVDRKGLFIPAVGGFFVGHILYIVTMMRIRPEWRPKNTVLVVLGVLVLWGVGFNIFLHENLGPLLRWIVPVYAAALLSMALFALSKPWSKWYLAVGAVSYVLSDSLIAINTFVLPTPWLRHVIWPTYVYGQTMIVAALIAERTLVHQDSKPESSHES